MFYFNSYSSVRASGAYVIGLINKCMCACMCQNRLVAIAASLFDTLWRSPPRCHTCCITDTWPSVDLCHTAAVKQCHHLCQQHRVGAADPRSAFCRSWSGANWSHSAQNFIFFWWRWVRHLCR